MPEINSEFTPLQKAFLVIKDLQQRLKDASEQSAGKEDIAVIGIACHLPGNINSATEMWDALIEERDLIAYNGLANRWRGIHTDDHYFDNTVSHAGLLEDIAGFDNDFFHISPTEAQFIDPQHRHMLMVAYKAFEDAGIASQSLKNSETGIFIGISAVDYSLHLMQQPGQTAVSPYLGSGNSLSAASGRLSYFFGCNGPSLSIDTACSSSMVALHQACASLRAGECNLALTGGVNFLLSSQLQDSLAQAGMLSPDGHCKTFDDSADGYVRSEGCLAIVLKKLSDAEKDGDRIYACIKATAIAQDGASGGLTVPNPVAQASVIKQALKTAGITANDVDFLEAHGTGTSLGDPVEMEGLKLGYGEWNNGKKMRICSIKTNVGHLEAAAGLAGIIKASLSLYHKKLPGHLHYNTPNKHIAWETLPVELNTKLHDYSNSDKLLIAGVSSFGFTGAIAHCILAEYNQKTQDAAQPGSHQTLVITAPTITVLENLRSAYLDYLSNTNHTLQNICYTAAIGKNIYKYALLSQAADKQTMISALQKSVPLTKPLSEIGGIIKGGKVSLPHYAFTLTPHWVGPLPGNIHPLNQYQLAWKAIDVAETEAEQAVAGIYLHINPTSSVFLQGLQTNPAITTIPVYWQQQNNDKAYPYINTQAGLAHFFEDIFQQYKNQSVYIVYDISGLHDHGNDEHFNDLFKTSYQNILTCLQTLSASQLKPASFIVLTQQAAQVTDSDKTIEPLQYSITAWARSASLELPNLHMLLFDIGLATTANQLGKQNIAVWFQQQYHQQLALREGRLYYQVIAPDADNTTSLSVKINKEGVYLITGGNGSLGKHVAQWLQAQNAGKIILASRNTQQKTQQINHNVIHTKLDVSDPASVTAFSNWLTNNNLELKGIIHAAGISHRKLFKDMSWADIEKVAHAKVNGLRNLANHLPLQSLDFFVAYSSIASVWGSAMLSHYAAVNAYMDAYIVQMRLNGIPAKAINWGPWADSNMMLQDENSEHVLRETGIITHKQDAVLKHYAQLLHPQHSQQVYVQLDKQRFIAVMQLQKQSAFWDELRTVKKEQADTTNQGLDILDEELQKSKPAERYKKIQQIIAEQLCLVLAIDDVAKIDCDRNFSDMGMDSILVIRFIEKLQKQFKQPITTNMIFNFHTVKLFSQHINDSFFGTKSPAEGLLPNAEKIANLEFELNMMKEDELHALINADIQKYF